jgi:hypothetical protein
MLSILPFMLCIFFVIINLVGILLYISCNDKSLCVGVPQSMVACVLILGFFHCVSGFGHVGNWVNVHFVLVMSFYLQLF